MALAVAVALGPGCGAGEDDVAPGDADREAVADRQATSAATAEGATPMRAALPGLVEVMAGLKRDMAALSAALWRTDLDTIANHATAIANLAPLQAQNPQLAGSYRFVADESDDIDQAIREATEEAGFFVRTVGRGMLADKLAPPTSIRIALTDTTVIITEDGSGPRTVRLDGTGSNDSRVTEGPEAMWVDESLVLTFREEDGVRRYEYSAGPDGDALTVDVTVEGSRLPQPIRYRLTYAVRVTVGHHASVPDRSTGPTHPCPIQPVPAADRELRFALDALPVRSDYPREADGAPGQRSRGS